MEFVLSHSIIFQGILLIENFEVSSFVVLAIFLLIIIYFYISFIQTKIHDNDIVINLDHKFYRGFIDSGNQAWYKGYPLIFLSDKIVDQYDVIDSIYINTAYRKEKVDIVLIGRMDINFETFYNVYAGKMNLNEYDCILNTYLLGGVL